MDTLHTTSDTFTIRLATLADHAAVIACIKAAFNKWVPVIGMKPLALTANYEDYIQRGLTYVLVDNSKADVAGLLIFWQVGDALYLDTIAVNPAYQKHGLGRRLLDFTGQKAREMGLDKITLVTNEKMVSNQEYYRTNGFVETHRHALHEGRIGVWMCKSLASN